MKPLGPDLFFVGRFSITDSILLVTGLLRVSAFSWFRSCWSCFWSLPISCSSCTLLAGRVLRLPCISYGGVQPGWSGPGDPTALTSGFQNLTTTVLSTGSPVTACGLLPPVFQPQTGPPADSPGSSVPACRSVTTADSHRTKKEAEAEPPTSPPRTTAHTAGVLSQRMVCHCPCSSLSSTWTQKVLREHAMWLVGFQSVQTELGVQSTLRRGTWPQLSPTLVCSPGAEKHGGSPHPTLPQPREQVAGRLCLSARPDSAAGGPDGEHPGRAAGGQQHLPNARQPSNTGQPRPHRG